MGEGATCLVDSAVPANFCSSASLVSASPLRPFAHSHRVAPSFLTAHT